jgi:hypothetical protein
MFPVALQRLRVSLRGGVALAVEFATLGEVVLEHPDTVFRGENQDRSSAGRLIGEQRAERRGTVTAVQPECESRVRAPSREPRRRRPEPEPAFQFCLDD